MHRFNMAWTMTAIVLLSPTLMLASDKQTGQQIADALKQSGRLVGFRIGVKYQEGTAWLKGRVSSEEQKALAIQMTEQLPEVSQVVDELTVEPASTAATPVFRPVANGPLPAAASSICCSPTQRLAPQEPVVHAAKTPRGIAAGLLRIAQPTVDPNVQTTGGELSFPTAEARSSEPTPHLAAQPTVQPASTKRSIIRRRTISSSQSPTPAMAPTAAPVTANVQGRQMNLIPLVRGPDGNLVPLDPAMAQQMGLQAQPVAGGQQMQKIPLTNNNSARSKQGRRGRPMPIASRNQGGRPVPAAYNAAAGGPPGGVYPPGAYPPGAVPPGALPAMEGVPGAPLPGAVPAPIAGPAPAYYDQPNMPNYAWPSYAAYPNYAALTYPKQNSPTAWPYIGPFYPYPQVPLGWRKVTLEWDDGWWFLDFDDRNCQ